MSANLNFKKKKILHNINPDQHITGFSVKRNNEAIFIFFKDYPGINIDLTLGN